MLKRFGLLFFVALGGLALIGWWSGWFESSTQPVVNDPAPPDPRLTYQGPYKNVHPDVKYVGDKACAECHPIMTQGFHDHPMSKTLLNISEVIAKPHFQKDVSFTGFGNTFELEIQGNKLFHIEKLFDREKNLVEQFRIPVDFVVGSGHRGHSFFSLQNNALYQTPISWYTQKQIWDISPGFQQSHLRAIPAACLFCHSGGVNPVPLTRNKYEKEMFWNSPSINCERCHGPGELHVKARLAKPVADGSEDTIVNPANLSLELREAICQQCHLEGTARIERRGRTSFDYRPGMPLSDFMTIFVHADKDTRGHAVSHVEQMYLSKCFLGSKGTANEMGCLSCHDVHGGVDHLAEENWYRGKCLECHTEQGDDSCHLSLQDRKAKQPQDDCTACHMPRFQATDIVHTAATDHRILRNPMANPDSKPKHTQSKEEHPFVPFHSEKLDLSDPEMRRDYGLALSRRSPAIFATGQSAQLFTRSLELLKEAVNNHPSDLDARMTLIGAYIEGSRSNPEYQQSAIALLNDILDQFPDFQLAHISAFQIRNDRNEWSKALPHLKKLREIEPTELGYARSLAMCQIKLQQWEQALESIQSASQLQPIDPLTNMILVYTLRKLGKHGEAIRHTRILNAMDRKRVEEIRGYFDSFLKLPVIE